MYGASHDPACLHDCSGHGRCLSGKGCACYQFYYGRDCSVDLRAEVGEGWWAIFVAVVCVVDAWCALRTLFYLAYRSSVTGRCCQTSFVNYRDTASILNVIGCITRVGWLLLPSLVDNTVAFVLNGLLLRIPQLMWICALLCIVLIWVDVLAALNRTSVTPRTRWSILIAVIVLIGAGVPLGIIDAMTPHPVGTHDYFAIAGDALIALYTFTLTGLGGVFTVRLWHAMRAFDRYAGRNPAPHFKRVREHVQRAFLGMVMALVLAATLIISLGVRFGANLGPGNNPAGFFAFMWVVHVFVEGTSTWIIFWNSRMHRRQRGGRRATLLDVFFCATECGAEETLEGGLEGASVSLNSEEESAGGGVGGGEGRWTVGGLSDSISHDAPRRDISGLSDFDAKDPTYEHNDPSLMAGLSLPPTGVDTFMPASLGAIDRQATGLLEGEEIRYAVRNAPGYGE